MTESQDERNGDRGRENRRAVEQLEIEIHQEKVRVLIDGASQFLSDERRVELLMVVVEKILDRYFAARAKNAAAAFGVAMVGALFLGGLAWLGWKGWAGPSGAGR